jgi:pentalenene oxygenase
MHHKPDLYPDPDRFDPDRWRASSSKLPRGGFIPFTAGARKCLGDTFTMTENILALASIASRWKLEPVSGEQPRLGLSGVLSLKPMPMRVLARLSPPACPSKE